MKLNFMKGFQITKRLTKNIKDQELLFTKMIGNQATAFSKTLEDEEMLFARLIRNQDGRVEVEFPKIDGKIVLIQCEMTLVVDE